MDVAGGGARPIDRLTLIDQVPAPPTWPPTRGSRSGRRASCWRPGRAATGPGPAAGPGPLAGADLVFHLAAAVSGECEADFDLGIRANLRATEALLAACRAAGHQAAGGLLQFARGVRRVPRAPAAGRGRRPDAAEPAVQLRDQKLIGEQLLADYTRKGFLRGRAIRLMTVSVRPGRPNAAASGFLSGIIREPLAGQRAVCPVDRGRPRWRWPPPARAIEALRCAATSPDEVWGGRTAVTMPGLTVTVGDMVAALERVAGPAVTASSTGSPTRWWPGMVSGWACPVSTRTGQQAWA